MGTLAGVARNAGVPVAAVAGSVGGEGYEALALAALEIAACRRGATARVSDIEDAALGLAKRLQGEIASVGPVKRPL